MPDETIRIRTISAEETVERSADLADILVDCVTGGASVSFMAPLSHEKAQAFWGRIAEGVARSERVLLIAEDHASGKVIGTVQLMLDQPENQRHRADVQKLLVRRRDRRRGIGRALVAAVEDAARAAGKTLLVLDTTQGGDAERLYERAGWTRFGVVPGHALLPDGRPSDTSYFYKRLC
jgi:GNAT superfamily N-acetyltransferase